MLVFLWSGPRLSRMSGCPVVPSCPVAFGQTSHTQTNSENWLCSRPELWSSKTPSVAAGLWHAILLEDLRLLYKNSRDSVAAINVCLTMIRQPLQGLRKSALIKISFCVNTVLRMSGGAHMLEMVGRGRGIPEDGA